MAIENQGVSGIIILTSHSVACTTLKNNALALGLQCLLATLNRTLTAIAGYTTTGNLRGKQLTGKRHLDDPKRGLQAAYSPYFICGVSANAFRKSAFP